MSSTAVKNFGASSQEPQETDKNIALQIGFAVWSRTETVLFETSHQHASTKNIT
jgi:hypothetical protein